MKAWYFAPPGEVLRYEDNRKIEVGKMHTVKGKPVLCEHGLHGSVKLLDALQYAQSPILYQVEISRHVVVGEDKIAGQRRQYLARIDAIDVLREFARKQALINIKKIEPYCKTPTDYVLIVKYLETGKDELRSAAESAAESAARSVAWAAAGAAAGAAWSAAWAAAEYAAEYAAWAAAWSAFESAAAAAREQQNTMLTEMIKKEIESCF